MNELDFTIKEAVNEPIKDYLPGSSDKVSLKAKLKESKSLKSVTLYKKIMKTVLRE